MPKSSEAQLPWPVCSLLLFVATSAEEDAFKKKARELGLDFRKNPELTRHFRERGLRDDAWTLGTIGGETVVAVGCSRIKGNPVMTKALAIYLDERFSVSSRRHFGLL